MKLLSVGEHTYEVTWVLSAQHCDGAFTVVEESCLPAGELPIDGGPLTVTTPSMATQGKPLGVTVMPQRAA